MEIVLCSIVIIGSLVGIVWFTRAAILEARHPELKEARLAKRRERAARIDASHAERMAKNKAKYEEKKQRLDERRTISGTVEIKAEGISIKGINKVGIDDSFLGDFEGTLRAEPKNPYDRYAVGVFVGPRRVGYLPGGNEELSLTILAAGGIIPCTGYISKSTDETGRSFYYGSVDIDCNPSVRFKK